MFSHWWLWCCAKGCRRTPCRNAGTLFKSKCIYSSLWMFPPAALRRAVPQGAGATKYTLCFHFSLVLQTHTDAVFHSQPRVHRAAWPNPYHTPFCYTKYACISAGTCPSTRAAGKSNVNKTKHIKYCAVLSGWFSERHLLPEESLDIFRAISGLLTYRVGGTAGEISCKWCRTERFGKKKNVVN